MSMMPQDNDSFDRFASTIRSTAIVSFLGYSPTLRQTRR